MGGCSNGCIKGGFYPLGFISGRVETLYRRRDPWQRSNILVESRKERCRTGCYVIGVRRDRNVRSKADRRKLIEADGELAAKMIIGDSEPAADNRITLFAEHKSGNAALTEIRRPRGCETGLEIVPVRFIEPGRVVRRPCRNKLDQII